MMKAQRKNTNQLSQSDKAIINKAIKNCDLKQNSKRK